MATKKSTTAEPTDESTVETTTEPAAEVIETDEAPAEVAPSETVMGPEPTAVAEKPKATRAAKAKEKPATAEDAAETEAATPPAPTHEVIVVDAPVQPRKKGNRALGVLLAFAGTVVFTALLAVAAILIPSSGGGSLTDPKFYFPPILFFIGSSLVSIVLNRAGWWSHIAGSIVVGLIVWFGSASLVLVSEGMLRMNQTEANDVFYAALFSPLLIVAALLAREVAVWIGAVLARRGRTLKVRNVEAQQAYEREQAELVPTA